MMEPMQLRQEEEDEDDPIKTKRQHLCRAIGYGQLLSFIVALSALVTKMIFDKYNVSSPALQTMIGYATIALACLIPCGGFHALKTQSRRTIFALFLVAIADSQADFIGNFAYSFSVSIASVGMLSSFTIPCVMLLSCCFLKVRYRFKHYLGTSIALLGLVFVVLADILSSASSSADASGNTGNNTSDNPDASNAVIGDFLVILGSVFYAISNVATEAFVKGGNVYEFLFWLGSFGFCITLIQFLVLEVKTSFANVKEPDVVWLWFVSYALLFSAIYYGCARYLGTFDAVLFNLSLLTTDVWGLLIGFFIFGEEIQILKILGFFAVVIGVVLYNMEQPIRGNATVLDESRLSVRPLVSENDIDEEEEGLASRM